MDLSKIHKHLSSEKELIKCIYDGMPVTQKETFADFCKNNHPEYYKAVLKVIYYLGSKTLSKGHSERLDRKKNRFYNLIGI